MTMINARLRLHYSCQDRGPCRADSAKWRDNWRCGAESQREGGDRDAKDRLNEIDFKLEDGGPHSDGEGQDLVSGIHEALQRDKHILCQLRKAF